MKKVLLILGLLLLIAPQSEAGIFSRMRNWANTGWDDCPCYQQGYQNGYSNGYYAPHPHGRYANGTITGFTPPIMPVVPSIGNYQTPFNGRFNQFPNGVMPTVNVPTQVITDFNSNVGTRTGVTILD